MPNSVPSIDGLTDAVMDARTSRREVLASGFQKYERHDVEFSGAGATTKHTYDLLRAGAVVGVLPLDVSRGRVVLLRQFRYAAHLATGRGMLVEMVAGRIEPNETPSAAAARECLEEIGVAPQILIPLYRSMPSPGISDEIATLFVAIVDSSEIPERAGLAAEGETTHPFVTTFDEAIAALDRDTIVNSLLLQGLQWLAIHRRKLPFMTLQDAEA